MSVLSPRDSLAGRPRWMRGALVVLLTLAAVAAILYQRGAFDAVVPRDAPGAKSVAEDEPQAERPLGAKTAVAKPDVDTPDTSTAPANAAEPPVKSLPARPSPLVIENVTLRNEAGRVVYRGSVDLAPTLDRIRRGERLSFPHDGAIFQNREGRLPRKSAGYYREYVHPTPRLPGPGPQRIVTGGDGEVYYTADHYQTFRKLDATIRRQ